MKHFLTISLILITGFCFGQKNKPVKDTVSVDTVITVNTPILSIADIDRVLTYLDDKISSKDYRIVVQALQITISEAEKRKNIKPK